MTDFRLRYEQIEHGRLIARQYVLDTIEAVKGAGDLEAAEYLEDMLIHDGPDLDGCVVFLGKHGLATQEWVDRLTEISELFDDCYDELEELKEYLPVQTAKPA